MEIYDATLQTSNKPEIVVAFLDKINIRMILLHLLHTHHQ